VTEFIEKEWIKTSKFPKDFIPSDGIEFIQSDENNECTIKGFYERKTGVTHIQEIEHNT
jgi:hypothetical protein